MLTVTSKTTRAELAAEVERLGKERQKVVNEALKAARTHGWCEVVQDTIRQAGLGDLLPPVYVVQEKVSGRNAWRDDSDWESFDNKTEALQAARENREYHTEAPRENVVEHVCVDVVPGNVSVVRAAIERQIARVEAASSKKAEWTPPKYPQYRVVLRKGTVDEVVEIFA